MKRLLVLLCAALGCIASAAMPVGIGVNVHTVQIATFMTKFPFASWVRVDDVAPGSWSVTTAQSLVSYYQGLTGYSGKPLAVVYLVSTSWGSSAVVGHARDVAMLVKPDVEEIYNEPQYDGLTSAAAQASDIQHIRQWGFAGLSAPLLAGPCCANTNFTAGDNSNSKTYSDAFIAAGGANYIDVVSWHPYPTTSEGSPPETTLPNAATTIKSWYPRKPLMWTEFTPGPGDMANLGNATYDQTYALYGGSWTAGNDAAVYSRTIQGAAPDPFCLYDGPYDGNPYQSMLQSGNTTAATQLTALIALTPANYYPHETWAVVN